MRRLVYLISPQKLNKNFYKDLEKVLSFKNVKFFQLRLKNTKRDNLFKITKKIKKITKKHNVKFILNDNPFLTITFKADGCHMGQLDGSLKAARKKLKVKSLELLVIIPKILQKMQLNLKQIILHLDHF